MDAEKLVKTYIKIRDAKQALEREMEEKVNALQKQLDLVEQELLELCKKTGQDGGKTAYGSFTRSVKTRYWTQDWDSMYTFIRTHDAPELLKKCIHQSNFKEFLSNNPDKLPNGVNVESKYSITVRRSRS